MSVPRRVLITGASHGSIGFATAQALIAQGAEVTVTARSRATDLAGELGAGVLGHDLDLTSRDSVAAFATWFGTARDGLDVLINNAGVHLDLRSKLTEPLLVDGHEAHWRTNYLGAWQLTSLLLPTLAQGVDPRVVNLTSRLHRRGTTEALFDGVHPYNSWVAYGTSKLALVHHAAEITRRHPGVAGFAVDPGEVYTNIADRGLQTSPRLARIRAKLGVIERRILMTPEEGARTSVHCATAPDLEPGFYRHSRRREKDLDAAVSARLWDATAAWDSGLSGS